MRSDAPLVKHLAKYHNPKTAWAWQTLPLVELPHLALDRKDQMYAFVDQAAPQTFEMPFHDFVFDVWFYNDDDPEARKPSLHSWIRVASPEEYLRRRALLSPWDAYFHPRVWGRDAGEFVALRDDVLNRAFVVIEVWTANEDRFGDGKRAMSPFSFALIGDRAMGGRKLPFPLSVASANVYRELGREGPMRSQFEKLHQDLFNTDINTALMLTRYLTVCPEYLVEATPVIPPGTKPRRHPDPKPWTYEYLPRLMLLDPAQTSSGEEADYQGGTHASPRPHQRRGHWATLRHPKFRRNDDGTPHQVFVRPAWVGPREWIMAGNRYRVVENSREAVA